MIDSKVLAYMLKSDMLPAAYVPSRDTMENKMILRSRMSLVGIRTQIKNRIHAIADRNRDSYPSLEHLADIFGKAGRSILRETEINPTDYRILSGYLDLIDEIDKRIKDLEKQIDIKSLEDTNIKLLRTMPGVGSFLVFLIKSEIDDIERFPSKEKLASYAGLIPSTHGSADRLYHGRITKQGNKFLRWGLVEAAQTSIRYSSYFRYHYGRIKSRKNANTATIAVARRIAEIIYFILKEKRGYIEEPIDIK